MKHRGFNIRHIIRPSEPSSIHYSNNDSQLETAASFQQFFSMFKTFLQSNSIAKPSPISARPQYQLEPRDREVSIGLPQPNAVGKLTQRQLKQWTTSVIKDIFSSAFNSYSRNQMTFEQAKIYCSQNFLKNLVRINQQYELSENDLEMMDSHIKNGVLSYMEAKYPLTDSSVINKRLQQAVREVDSIQSLANNYFTTSPIIFQLRKSANYNDLIMLMINDLISKSDNSGENSSFQEFESLMSDLFAKVEDLDWVKKQTYLASLARSEIDSRQNNQETQQQLRRRIEEKEKYRANVKEYTHYLIGKKISENTPLYSESEIQSGNLEIKSPQILRILTKWCEQLEEKYKNRYFSNRSESVKVQRGNKVKSLLAWMRQKIDDDLEKQKESIYIELQEMYKNNYQMQVKIMKYELERKGDEHIDTIERVSGKFSYKIVNNLRQYMIDYLNKLIHGILKAAKRVHAGLTESIWPSPPCLLSFKIGDLLRCKCSSREKEILRIYEEINRLSKENPEKLKIVRIKNRLKSGTNDILINIRFNDSILCEIQLAIDSKTSTFIKCSNMFHHYIYELERSLFGPISQLCSIWSSLDNRVNLYKQLVEEQDNESRSRTNHECLKLNTSKMVPLSKPFMCSSCKRTYCHNSFIQSHLQCKACSFSLCVRCRIEEQDITTSKTRFLKDPSLIEACGSRVDRNDELPKFGICLDLKVKLSQAILYSIVSYQKVDYILKRENGQIYEICKYVTQKDKRNFRNNYIIFSITDYERYKPIDQKQAITKFILPLMMKQNFQKQKDTISLMGLQLTTEECRQILSVGDYLPKDHVKNMFLSTYNIDQLPFSASTFPNIEWLTLSKNKNLKSVTGIGELRQLRKLVMSTFSLKQLFVDIYDCESLEQLAKKKPKLHLLMKRQHVCKILNSSSYQIASYPLYLKAYLNAGVLPTWIFIVISSQKLVTKYQSCKTYKH